ncbi:MAG: hypothetical protein ABSG48_07110 [Geobacteraceae bacterium]|jgi:hypothetical protein
MLSYVIDGQAKTFELNGGDSLATILNGLHGDLANSGRFIASLLVNGEEIAGIEKETSRRLKEIDSIEITTESPDCLVVKLLAESRNFIEGLQNYLTQVAGHYTSGSDCADGSFAHGIQGLQWFVQMTDFIKCTLQLDFQELSLNGIPVAKYVKSLNCILREIVNAQEESDPVLLADILVYDLVPHLEEWKEIYNLFEGQSEGKHC